MGKIFPKFEGICEQYILIFSLCENFHTQPKKIKTLKKCHQLWEPISQVSRG
jgi:hypothetical protein